MSDITPLQAIEPARRFGCALDDIAFARQTWERKNRHPAALSAREALVALQFEATFVSICSSTLAEGTPLSTSDHDRLWLATTRINRIVDEVIR